MSVKTEKTVGYRNSSEIFALITSFESCTLPPADWTREAYLTVIFWYLYMNPLPEAGRLIRDGVKRYNFEHNIVTTADKTQELPEKFWIRKVNEYLRQNRNAKLFFNNVNQMLEDLAGEKSPEIKTVIKNYQTKNRKSFDYRRRHRVMRQTIRKQPVSGAVNPS